MADLGFRRIRVLSEERDAGHHHSGRAETALEAVLLPEAFLDRMEVIRLSGLSEGTAAISIAYGGAMRVDGEIVPAVNVEAPRDWPSRQLDARNGKDYSAPK